jgi:outer membrane protein OmpA-like peptidoglycan-associated protein
MQGGPQGATNGGAGAGVDPNYDASGNSQRKAVTLTQTSRGAQITVDSRVFFDTGKAEIKAEGLTVLDRVATLVKERSVANVVIEGHTDSTGSPQINQRLSEQRADSVRGGLVARGVSANRFQTKGLASSQPVADNATDAGRAQNRRVEIVLLGESVERIGGKAEEERLASGLEKLLQNTEAFVRGAFDRIGNILGGEKK